MPPRYPSFAQTLEDLLSAIRVGVQQPRDARLEGIKDTAARPAAPRLKARTRRPHGDLRISTGIHSVCGFVTRLIA